MNILTEIHRSADVNTTGRTIYRTAVRGVALRGRALLLIHSSQGGDYKFPGGGLNGGETHAQTLSREVQEESGMSVVRVGVKIGTIIEYDRPMEKDYDVFKMTSHYYRCEVEGGFGAQKLDRYEQELGFKPVWINIDHVIQLNQALLYSDKAHQWLRREIFILEYIRETLLPHT